MIFIYKKWDEFCEKLALNGFVCIPAKDVDPSTERYLVLKHDIENSVSHALRMAEIENKYGICGSYYVHAYLLEDSQNLKMLRRIMEMGHEVSYHHDVMDSNHGDISAAIIEFEHNIEQFRADGFDVVTVCQHGNPVVERNGYTSNRDFFRNETVRKRFPDISDIMVDFPEKHHTQYSYYSDAGRRWNLIADPFFNDVVNSDDQNVPYDDLDQLFTALSADGRAIVSTHPHRWTDSASSYLVKEKAFKAIKTVAKAMMKIPVFKRIMSRYYYLAKKI